MYAMRINLFILDTIKNNGFAMCPGNLKSNLKKEEVFDPEFSFLFFESKYADTVSFFKTVFFGRITS
tara:strand:- start:41 stop:241 length:201 start_codon:yes stop_codon:yes gene_type:complete